VSHQQGGEGFMFWNARNDYSKPFAAMPGMEAAMTAPPPPPPVAKPKPAAGKASPAADKTQPVGDKPQPPAKGAPVGD